METPNRCSSMVETRIKLLWLFPTYVMVSRFLLIKMESHALTNLTCNHPQSSNINLVNIVMLSPLLFKYCAWFLTRAEIATPINSKVNFNSNLNFRDKILNPNFKKKNPNLNCNFKSKTNFDYKTLINHCCTTLSILCTLHLIAKIKNFQQCLWLLFFWLLGYITCCYLIFDY